MNQSKPWSQLNNLEKEKQIEVFLDIMKTKLENTKAYDVNIHNKDNVFGVEFTFKDNK